MNEEEEFAAILEENELRGKPADYALISAALQIIDALENEGQAKWYHRRVWARHRKEWPALWEGIDNLRKWYVGQS